MATIRQGSKAVLLVVDVQVGVVREAHETARVVGNIALAVKKARSQGVPVIWVQHEDEELIRGSADWQMEAPLAPREGEVRIYKRYNSSFEDTELEETLARLGAAQIYLAGAATNWCIRATAYAALERGYDLTLLKDGHTTGTMEFEDGRKVEAADVILDLNVAMKWLSYPGRKNAAVAAAELDFAAPASS